MVKGVKQGITRPDLPELKPIHIRGRDDFVSALRSHPSALCGLDEVDTERHLTGDAIRCCRETPV